MDPQFPYPISLSNWVQEVQAKKAINSLLVCRTESLGRGSLTVYWAARASSVMVKMSLGKLGSCGVSWEVDDDDLAEWEEGRREVEVEGRWPARFLDETEEDRDEEEVVERECAGWILLLLLCWLLMAIKEEDIIMIFRGLKDGSGWALGLSRGCRWCSGMRRLKGTVLRLGRM
jgi:hypothetical protein